MNISVIGSGYVGTTTSALLAAAGHSVTAIDIDEAKVEAINSGKAPFYETGLDLLIAYGRESKNLTASGDYDSLGAADVIFSCVGTPDNPDGSPNLRFINEVAKTVASKAKAGAIFVQKSTVPVGTGERLSLVTKDQIYASNPEFLREGTAITDSLNYDRLIIGCNDQKTAQTIERLFKSINEAGKDINRVAEIGLTNEQIKENGHETIFTSVKSAELIKVTANAFLALKISFANSVAKLADKSGADIGEVMNGIGSDNRIGRSFLNAGRGYGGGCFPKDVSGLISVAIDHGVDFGIMTAATDLNESMPGYIVNKVAEVVPLKNKSVAVLGLAFKAGTSDSRKSPSVDIANIVSDMGAKVLAYDPQANEEAAEDLNSDVTLLDSAATALKNADVVFVATDWPEFKDLPIEQYKSLMSGKIVVDCMNCLDKAEVERCGLTYIGVGR